MAAGVANWLPPEVRLKDEKAKAKQVDSLFIIVTFAEDPKNFIQIMKSELTREAMSAKLLVDVKFLQDRDTGELIWPTRWASECSGPPTVYVVGVAPPEEISMDALEEDEYRGDSKVCVFNVPEEVPKIALRAWLRAGLDDEFPELQHVNDRLEELNKKHAFLKEEIKNLPNSKSDTAENMEEELEYRRQRAQALAKMVSEVEEEKEELEKRKAKLEADTEQVRLHFGLRKLRTTPPINDSVWEVDFGETRSGQSFAYAAAHKKDWHEYYCYMERFSEKIFAGKGKEPKEKGAARPLNMRFIVVMRAKHGKGLQRLPKDTGFYMGEWSANVPHGVGTLMNKAGKFQGTMELGQLRGPTTAIYSRGDLIRAKFGITPVTRKDISYLNGDEYADGLPNGPGAAQFVDGSKYEGYFVDGVPAGQGTYTDVTGKVFEGHFDHFGMLHGEGATTSTELAQVGNWHRGLMELHGTEIDTKLGTYAGDFAFSLRHGFGAMKGQKPEHRMYARHEYHLLTGRAFMDVLKDEEIDDDPLKYDEGFKTGDDDGAELGTNFSEQKTIHVPEFGMHRFEGRWRAGHVRGGSVYTHTRGKKDPLDFRLQYICDHANEKLPYFAELQQRPFDVSTTRYDRHRVATQSILAQRRKREKANAKRFESLTSIANDNMSAIANKNKQDRIVIDEIAAKLREERLALQQPIRTPPRTEQDKLIEAIMGKQQTTATAASEHSENEDDDELDDGEEEEAPVVESTPVKGSQANRPPK